jgi:transposase-like protein
MPAPPDCRLWTADHRNRLEKLYALADSEEQLAELAAKLGVTLDALRRQAKRQALKRPPVAPSTPFDADADAQLRRSVAEVGPAEGVAAAAAALGVSVPVAAGRWRQLERRRRARIGDWSEPELAQAVATRRVPGRSEDETGLRLLSLGVRAAQDKPVSLGEMADRTGLGFEQIEEAVLAGELQAARTPGAAALPDRDWRTTEQRVGAWLVAFPHLFGRLDDPLWALRLVFASGIRVGQALSVPISGE